METISARDRQRSRCWTQIDRRSHETDRQGTCMTGEIEDRQTGGDGKEKDRRVKRQSEGEKAGRRILDNDR